MAHKRLLSAPMRGMNFIWNIDEKVGTQTSERNNPDDVLLVKLLFSYVLVKQGHSAAPGCKAVPQLNGNMDQSLGFWIYFAQAEGKSKFTVDGAISPIKGYPSEELLIFRLNFSCKEANQSAWENLPNHPMCSPSLKARLLAPPKTH